MLTGRHTRVLALLCVVAAVVVGCATPEDHVDTTIEDARVCAGRRDYEQAHQLLDAAVGHVGEEFSLLFEKAEIYARASEFNAAAEWYGRASVADPGSWKALARGWEAEFGADGESDESLERVLGSAREFLAAAPESLVNLSAFVSLSLAIVGEDAAESESDRLSTLYPDSELGGELIKEEVDWIGVERDDQRRLEMADEFLENHPVSKWRARVMRLKLVSLKRLNLPGEVEAAGRLWASRHADSAEDLNVVAAALVSCRRVPDEAAELAGRALELELARCAEDGIRVERRGDRMRLMPERGTTHDQEDLDKRTADIASYALTQARALLIGQNFEGAETAGRRAMSFLALDTDDEETGAAYRFTLGQALENLGRYDDALDEYLAALLTGGRQNRWPARADTAARRLFEVEFAGGDGERTLLDHARDEECYDGPVFKDVTVECGLDGRNESRVAWGDYDGDGWDDLLLNGRVLMVNRGAGMFTDVTAVAGIGETGANGGVWADIDNDGDLDFYATSGATSGEKTDRLWINRGNGTFEDGTASAGGMTDSYTTEGAAWGDFNADGLVDLYLASYERPRTETFKEYGVGFPDILYRNEGGGVFANITEEAGLLPPFGEHLSGRGVNWGDYDNDGDLDIFVSNYRLQENLLWRNEGDGTFTNVAPALGVSGRETDGWWGHTIGSEWGDYDNDGDLDLASANLAHPRYIEVSDMSMLLQNEGAPSWAFTDARAASGIKYAETHSDPAWCDVDADGDLDLFITSIYPNCGTFLYRNVGRGRFEDITWLAGVRSFNGWGCAVSDYDLDGDLDIAVASGSGFRLFRNDGPARGGRRNHSLLVQVVGTASNASGIGARVEVKGVRGTQIREVQGGKGTTSQHSLTAFFGLGSDEGPVDVEVRFLGGATVMLENVDVDQRIVVRETDQE
jgi:tetratricopeptide (TPR) repeat protein